MTRRLIIAMTLASTVIAAPVVTYRVVNDCYKETIKEMHIVLPDGKVAQGITCTVVPQVVADTAKADTTKK